MATKGFISKLKRFDAFSWVAIIAALAVFSVIVYLLTIPSRYNTFVRENYDLVFPSTPAPTPTPIMSDDPNIQDWIQYYSLTNNFIFMYPPDMNIFDNVNEVRFIKGKPNDPIRTGFYVTKLNDDFIFSNLITLSPKDRKQYVRNLFLKPNGFHQVFDSGLSQKYLTKISSLTINGYDAVYFTEGYGGSTQEPPGYANKYIIRDGDSYYMIAQNYVVSKDKLKPFADTLRSVSSSFHLK